ncbi:MAG TPA: DUF5678 domain-containing protein [Candidatus Lokiarchaeia archaeon]|nr:DUF5678 domain-containing protein [Candidatus Lokiarchaeia archaeon]
MEVEETPEFWDNLHWGRDHYSELQHLYDREWVAISNRQVVSHGKNLREVEEEAERVTGDLHFYTTFVEAVAVMY